MSEQLSGPQDGQDGQNTPGGTTDTREDAQAQAAAQGQDDGQDGGDERGGNEAARYRRRLRETETERDGLRGTVERLQRREVERLAGEHLAAPADLFDIARTELADLLDDEGGVNAEAVRTAAEALVAARPGLARPGGARGGLPMGQGRQHRPTAGTTWGEALASAARGR